MLKIYTDLSLFEQVLCDEDDDVMLGIFSHHAEILMNISDADLEREEEKQDFVFHYQMAQGNRSIVALDYHFDNLDSDDVHYSNDPRALYLRDIADHDRDRISGGQGIMLLNASNLGSHQLDYFFDKDLHEGQVCKEGDNIGWHALLPDDLPPCNALVISDNHLFANENGVRGEQNICQLYERLLPDSLRCDFHLLLIAPEHKDYDTQSCAQLCGRIKSFLSHLNKPYSILFELVFAETIHKRIAIANYYSIIMDKGFAAFKTGDLQTAHEDTDIQIKGLFAVRSASQTSGLDQSNRRLLKVRQKVESVKEYISNRREDKNYRIFGDCNKDKSVNNRLINTVS